MTTNPLSLHDLIREPIYTGAPRSRTSYELPHGGISLLGYTVRRMHKTVLLSKALALATSGYSADALACVGLYIAGASASFGTAHYQPGWNGQGEETSEPDPATGASVRVHLAERHPHLRLAAVVALGADLQVALDEVIQGTQLTWHGLGMAAPIQARLSLGAYSADVRGCIVSELVPGLMKTLVRGHGELTLSDSLGQQGRVTLERSGRATATIDLATGGQHVRVANFGGQE